MKPLAQISLDPGVYVVAVSGGVDSVALLNMLTKQYANEPLVTLVVAHVDHGIRSDAVDDYRFVEGLAALCGLRFYGKHLSLGAEASEALARTERYAYLREVATSTQAGAIITAHQQDDLIETLLMNVLRGTGRRGLSSLRSRSGLLRPLLDCPKQQLITYALAQGLEWCQDGTNADPRYRRNRLRQQVMPRMLAFQRRYVAQLAETMAVCNDRLDTELDGLLAAQPEGSLRRDWFKCLPADIAAELMTAWLRQNRLAEFDARMVRRLVLACQTLATGKQIDIYNGRSILINRNLLTLSGQTPTDSV